MTDIKVLEANVLALKENEVFWFIFKIKGHIDFRQFLQLNFIAMS